MINFGLFLSQRRKRQPKQASHALGKKLGFVIKSVENCFLQCRSSKALMRSEKQSFSLQTSWGVRVSFLIHYCYCVSENNHICRKIVLE